MIHPTLKYCFDISFSPRPRQSSRSLPIFDRTRAAAIQQVREIYPEALIHSVFCMNP